MMVSGEMPNCRAAAPICAACESESSSESSRSTSRISPIREQDRGFLAPFAIVNRGDRWSGCLERIERLA